MTWLSYFCKAANFPQTAEITNTTQEFTIWTCLHFQRCL